MVTSIFINILVLPSFSSLSGVFEVLLSPLFKKNKMAGCKADENRKIDEGISLELCAVYGQRRQAS